MLQKGKKANSGDKHYKYTTHGLKNAKRIVPQRSKERKGNGRNTRKINDEIRNGQAMTAYLRIRWMAKNSERKPRVMRNGTHVHLAGCTGITRELYRETHVQENA